MVKDKKASEFATRDYTIHLSKRLYGVTFKKRAPRAVREVKKFAQQMMKTRCVAFFGRHMAGVRVDELQPHDRPYLACVAVLCISELQTLCR